MAQATPSEDVNGSGASVQNESDYGSDFGSEDETALTALISQAESQAEAPPLLLENEEEYDPLPHAAFAARSSQVRHSLSRTNKRHYIDEDGVVFEVLAPDGPLREPSVEVEYDPSNRTAFTPFSRSSDPSFERERSVSIQPEEEERDGRSPLERFRTAPKKPLSVTDIVSPAWCEIQYFYSLSKYGKVRKTPAMKQGSEVHKVLEEQVHTAVPVETETREDWFGLRIWNVIQGLRTLRTTGMTRELEVWAVVEGQVVNGIIDELSFTCPDEEMERKILERQTQETKSKETMIPANQKTMDAFLQGALTSEDSTISMQPPRKIYLTDVKTRASRKLPSGEAGLRPVRMQLMMYHRMLSLLASNSVPAEQVFARYSMDASAVFSDTFIAEIGGLDYNFRQDATDPAPSESSQDSVDELLAHNTLEKLWSLMMAEFAKTMPVPRSAALQKGGLASPLGDVLRVEYRARSDGLVLGTGTFEYDAAALDAYVGKEMAWWRGEKEARGVDIEEAFKCGICEFQEACTWRKGRLEEWEEKIRLRKGKRTLSGV